MSENGAGKTTFVKLLMRLYDPTEGCVLLDGADIRDVDIDAYRALFGMVFQDFKLFAFSLKENVCFGDDATDEAVVACLRRAGLGDKLSELKDGLRTHVTRDFDENGFAPSGGEAQKIALARAEYAMYRRMRDMADGKTVVFISHRLSSAQFSDRVAVFARGGIAELGTHEELCEKDGLYAEPYRMQADLYA